MRNVTRILCLAAGLAAVPAACGSDDSGVTGAGGTDGGAARDSGGGSDAGVVIIPASCNGSVLSTSTPATNLPDLPAVTVPAGFKMEVVAEVDSARELAALPNGDLLVATNGASIYIIPNAEADGLPGAAAKFADAPDANPAGIAYVPSTCSIYFGTNKGVYKADYKDGDQTGDFGNPIAHVRQGTPTPGSDGDVHQTTSVAFGNGVLYAGVGSGCNACSEVDPTRATIQSMAPDGTGMTTRATHIRNAIAVTSNPATGSIWAGGAGQDSLPLGHPYEFFDLVTSHPGTADYGWPDCEENHQAYGSGADCSNSLEPVIEFPAYSTLIGAAFYPANQAGSHAFPAPYKGGLFVAGHGSWHTTSGGAYFSAPRFAFVAMNGDAPATAVDWTDPTKQWTAFVDGWQKADGVTRVGRPTGVAVGSKGSVFLGDDSNGLVYRIRPM